MERRAVTVQGIVQGVGFRPHVWKLASRLALAGFVRNETAGVRIEVEGDPRSLEQFVLELRRDAPPLARITDVTWEPRPLGNDAPGFRIEASAAAAPASVFVSPDVATCDDCLREVLDPADRRYRYPFTNCTSCGPRLTIVTGAPYDRERTTMAGFPLCPACRAEYEDPADRRFHAQPVACPACGPSLRATDARGETLATRDDALRLVARALDAGAIAAVKGLGGYHLACDARSPAAVQDLRRKKHRDEKPFAILVADLEAARALAHVSPEESTLLAAPERPIVLVARREGAPVAPAVARDVAPGSSVLGVMLPYTPLHHLLIRAVGGPLVLTSGNRSDEPIAYEDRDALERLSTIASVFLGHDRPIHLRCDDSVVRVAGSPIPLRRSRGYAPSPIALPLALARPTLALGGHLKATFALGEGKNAFPSHHLGDLGHHEASRAYALATRHWAELLRLEPARLVHDRHPDYASTRLALAWPDAEERPIERLAVQHHHAHMASCMAENGLPGPAIGVVWDGAGLGDDGAIWGGEFLVGGHASARRAGHFRYVPLPGGERAIREPWRMALAHVDAAGGDAWALEERIPARELALVTSLIERRINCPLTSSVGRLFDAVASLAGLGDRTTFEGQAAMRLEAAAALAPEDGTYAFEVGTGEPFEVDPRPLVAEVAREARLGTSPELIARRFHATLVAIAVAACERIRDATSIGVVVLSGGCFQNAILARETARCLGAAGFQVATHRAVPPNDGGLSLGQLAIAAGRDALKG